MWTYQQFLAKHSRKYSSLNAAEKRKRYDDYVRTAGSAGQPQPAPKRAPRNSTLPRLTRERALQADPAVAAYNRMVRRPFDADTVGLPVFPAPPSSKSTSWLKGNFVVGTGGVGFIFGRPAFAADSQAWHGTTSSSASNSFSYATGGTTTGVAGTNGIIPYTQSNLPFVGSQFAGDLGQVRARCALAAIRVRYIGTEDKFGGSILPFVHPEHAELSGLSAANILAWEGVHSQPCSRNWVGAVWVPVHRTELEYVHALSPPAHDSVENAGAYSMGVMVTGATPGNTFEFEIVVHTEFIGTMTMTKTDNMVKSSIEGALSRFQNALASTLGYGLRAGTTSLLGAMLMSR